MLIVEGVYPLDIVIKVLLNIKLMNKRCFFKVNVGSLKDNKQSCLDQNIREYSSLNRD